MRFPCLTSRRREPKESKNAPEQAAQQPSEACSLGWTPISKGQLETERLLSGDDVHALDDLKALLERAEHISRQVPQLNLNMRATDRWLQKGSPGAIVDLVEEQKLAQMRLNKAASQQWLSFNLMRTSTLIGEPFKHSCRELCDDSLSSLTDVKQDGACRGHWQLHYCSGDDCCITSEDTEGLGKRPVASGNDKEEVEEEEEEEEEEEFSFDDYFTDEEKYQEALCEVTALAARPAPAKVVFVPARTASLRRKRGQNSLRELSDTEDKDLCETAPTERWSTQAATGSRESLNQGEKVPEEDVPQEEGARRSIRLSLTAGPISGPPAISLPPSPPVPRHLRSSWPLPNTSDATTYGVL